MYKDSVFFGTHLWLVGHLDKQDEHHISHVTFNPPTVTAVLPPSPSPSNVPLHTPVFNPLMNEELLKSIGFLPSNTLNDAKSTPPIKADSSGICDSTTSASGSSPKLLDTFELIEKPDKVGPTSALKPDQIEKMESGDFVMIVPDCFDLDKPISSFSPPESLSCMPEPSMTDLTIFSLADLSLSNDKDDKDMTCKSAANYVLSVADVIATPPTVTTTPEAINGDTSAGSSNSKTPSTAHKNLRGLTLRKLRGGLYRNPLTLATGLVNAVSEYVDDKVHFAHSDKEIEDSCPPKMKTSEQQSYSDSSEEEFEASI